MAGSLASRLAPLPVLGSHHSVAWIDAEMPRTFSQSELAGAGLRTYSRIAEAWNLSPEGRSTLIGLDGSSYAAALADPELLPDQNLQRVGLAIGIYQALHTIFAAPAVADTWIRRQQR